MHELVALHRSSALRWRERANMPLPRAGYIAGVTGEKLVIAGGSYWEEGKKLWTAQVDTFDPRTNRWLQSIPMPSPRSDAAAVSVGNALYVFGGGAHNEVRGDAWVFHDRKWSALPGAELPEARLYAVAASHNRLIYLMGGLSKAGDYSTVTNTLWVLNPRLPRIGWKRLPPIPGPGRIAHAVAELGAKIYVFGGATANGARSVRNLDDAYCFNTRNLTWTRLPNLPIARRAWWAVALCHQILLLGGYTQTYEKHVFEYRPHAAGYRQIGMLPHAVADAKFFQIRNLLVGAGGEAGNRIRGPWTIEAKLPRVAIRH